MTDSIIIIGIGILMMMVGIIMKDVDHIVKILESAKTNRQQHATGLEDSAQTEDGFR